MKNLAIAFLMMAAASQAQAVNSHLDKLNVYQAWEEFGKGDPSVIVAAVSAGIDPHHIEFKGAKILDGFNAVDGSRDTREVSSGGTGTVTAGLINGQISGVAPGVSLLPIVIYDDSLGGQTNDYIRGMQLAVENNARVVFLHGGGQGEEQARKFCGALLELIDSHPNVLFVASAPNESKSVPQWTFPVACTRRNIITVTATDMWDRLADFAAYGSVVDIGAYGADVPIINMKGRPAVIRGSSPATALVAATAALMFSKKPQATPAEVKKAIMDSVQNKGILWGKVNSAGTLDTLGALRALK